MRQSQVSFFNHYGPTECTVNTTICRVAGSRPSLGGPIVNVRVYVVDLWEIRCRWGTGRDPCGWAGCGDGLPGTGGTRPRIGSCRIRSRPNPGHGCIARAIWRGIIRREAWSSSAGSTTKSRSGVSASSWAESSRCCCARTEWAQAVVECRADSTGDRRLVAYWVGEATEGDLRTSLKSKLPDYMVPSTWIGMERLPLSPMGNSRPTQAAV